VAFAPQLAKVALEFQSPETFSLIFLALVAVATVDRGSLTKALAATVVGLMLSTVGLDKMLPVARFTLGSTNLLVGVPLLPVVIGLFAVSELFWQVGEASPKSVKSPTVRFNRIFDFWPEVKKIGWKLFGKSSLIGAFVGALPGGGAAMGAFLSYTEAKRSSKHPERFGTGAPEGIVAPETANNAVTGGAFIPMLAFGIPGDAVTAVILGGLLIQGITPGVQLFRNGSEVVYPLFVGYFLAYLVVLILGLGLLPWYARLATLDRALLFPWIAAVSMVAAYVAQRTWFAMVLTLSIGVFGYLMRRFGYPLVPVLMGLLLGPTLESSFRRALIVSERGPLIFLTSPISAALLFASVVLVFYFRKKGAGTFYDL
jgi:putative tricarboxylic transport membrane protein